MTSAIFALILTLTGQQPLEISAGVCPDGTVVAVALFAKDGGGTIVRAFERPPNQRDFQQVQIDAGDIFSLSKKMVKINGVLYFAAVRNFEIWLFRRNGFLDWESAPLTSSGGIIHSVDMTLRAAGLLAFVAVTSGNDLLFYQAAPLAVLAATTLSLFHIVAGIADPFNGGNIPTAAFDSQSGDGCAIARQLTGALIAACLIATVAHVVTLEILAAPAGFNSFIETSAVFHHGYFVFMYFLTSALVKLAAVNAQTLVPALVTLGVVAATAGFPGLSLIAGTGHFLYAFWPGFAVKVLLPTLAVLHLKGFPIDKIGPMAAVLLFTLASVSVLIFGSGSLVMTRLSEVAATPALGTWGLAAAVAVLLLVYLRRRRREIPPGSADIAGGSPLRPA